ncbi:carbohydrate binding domain-containing protein [Chitinispirillales bacterium ANBcel5]|uniref:carbohydrate binding domain-containing protein n=1 Tax=Cellulosispirillum alkaliphilum TaxID=3039283 RepID=UPI002A515F17|nr:carbohydrate binding domain-containing protein [Chitinispirillales bacterium ANBcel5]
MTKRTLLLAVFLLSFSLQAEEENLIRNGDFSSGTDNWVLETQDAVANSEILNNAYRIIIETQANEESNAPYLSQNGIELEQGYGYTFEFTAAASLIADAENTDLSIRVFIGSNDDSRTPYVDTSLTTFELSPSSPNTISIPFVMREETDNDVRVEFSGGVNNNLDIISIRNVSLTYRDEPVISITAPTSSTTYKAGAENTIRWSNTGTLSHVQILLSTNAGEDWSTIQERVVNVGRYTWQIPDETISDSCLIIIADTSATFADTSLLFAIAEDVGDDPDPVDPDPVDPDLPEGELVINGDFSDGSSNWTFETHGGDASGSVVDEEYVVTIDELSGAAWAIKLYQSDINLKENKTYLFSYEAYASEPRPIYANIGLAHGPYTSMTGGDTIPVRLSTEKRRFSTVFTIEEPIEDEIRVEFNLGSALGDVHIDNVSIIETDIDGVFINQPNSGTVWRNNSTQTIRWELNSDHEVITLEYSTDDGESWELIEENIEFTLGRFNWSVPDVVTDNARIRILAPETQEEDNGQGEENSEDEDAENGEENGEEDEADAQLVVIGQSEPFIINTLGVMFKYGELLINGSFANRLSGWNDLALDNGAEAEASIQNEILSVDIDNAGSSSDIVLSQNNIPVFEGKEYNISFRAFAAGTRSMNIKVISQDDDSSSVIFEEEVQLPSDWQDFSFDFTGETDAITDFEIHMGGSIAPVFIEEVSFEAVDPTSARPVANTRSRTNQSIRIVQNRGGRIIFQTPGAAANASIDIYSINGSRVKTLAVESDRVVWNGRSNAGRMVANGAYVMVYRDNLNVMTRSFVLR